MPEQVPPTQGTPLQPSSNSLTPSQAALSRSRSIFPKGRNFTLDDFSSRDFIVKDFIESLSDSAVFPNRRSAPNTPATNNGAPSATGNIAFDPKPLIRSFEAAQRRLEDLSGDLELRENELSAATRRAEAQHTGNTETLGRKLHETILAFTRLDTSLNGSLGSSSSGGNAAVEIGSRLEELERQRRRAMDAHFLIQCWDEVSNKGSLTLLEGMRRTGAADDKVRSAHIAKQLLRISQRLDPRSWGGGGSPGAGPSPSPMQNAFTFEQEDASGNGRNTREIIEKFAETLETDLLRQFDDCYRKANLDGMKDCATVLYDFNGGASVIAAFVNQHPFFIDSSQLVNEEVGGDAETWEQLADPDADPPGVEPSLQSLVDDVKVTVQDESTLYIRRAFPFYENVLAKFLQRVFQQSIQQRLELVLDKADSVSSLAFLRSLQAARSCINVLVDDLKAHGLTEHPDTISPSTAAILDQQLEELFVPYFSGNSYIEREKRNLEELYTSLMFKFATFHMRRKQTPKTFLTSLAKSGSELIASAKESYMSRLESSDFTPTQRAMLMRVAGLKNSSTDSPDPSGSKPEEIQLTEEDGQLSIAYAKRMLKWLAEGVGRSLELSGGAETARDVSSLLTMLLSLMGEQYIEAALDAASDAAMAQESSSKTAPAFAYLLHLRPAIAVTHLMRKCIETVLIPLAAGSPTVKREMEKRARAATGRIEERINSIQQRSIDVALAWVARCLAGQKKNDFRPREDSADGGAAYLGLLQTPTCTQISTFLSNLHKTIQTALAPSPPNSRSLLRELQTQILLLLLDHFKKFNVNPTGALMITKDTTRYADELRSWDVGRTGTTDSELSSFPSDPSPLISDITGQETQTLSLPSQNPDVEVLSEIATLFVVGPEALRERLRDNGDAAATGIVGKGGKKGASGAGAGSARPGKKGSSFGLVRDVRPYLLRREDVGSVGMQSVLAVL